MLPEDRDDYRALPGYRQGLELQRRYQTGEISFERTIGANQYPQGSDNAIAFDNGVNDAMKEDTR